MRCLINHRLPRAYQKRWHSKKALEEPVGVNREPTRKRGGGLGSLLNPSSHLLRQSPPLVLLHQPFPLGLNRWTLRGGKSRRARTWWKLEDFVQPAKKRLNELRSSKTLATLPAKEQKGRTFSSQSPKPGSQLPCLVVSL